MSTIITKWALIDLKKSDALNASKGQDNKMDIVEHEVSLIVLYINLNICLLYNSILKHGKVRLKSQRYDCTVFTCIVF